jgi:hypothetical protein
VPETFIYIPSSKTILSAITQQTLNATFMPTDTVDYTTASATASIAMTKVTLVTPTIICSNLTTLPMVHHWQRSVRYKYFSAWNLGIYFPLKIVLSAGTRISEVEFTPDDTANYSNVPMTVTINILNPAQKSH